MKNVIWKPDHVQAYLIEAADTLQRLPDHEQSFLSSTRVAWPSYENNYWEEFADAVADPMKLRHIKVRMGAPSRAAIDRFDVTMDWLNFITGDHYIRNRKLVFYSCSSMARWQRDTIKWQFVRKNLKIRMSNRHMRSIFNACLDKIAGELNFRHYENSLKSESYKNNKK